MAEWKPFSRLGYMASIFNVEAGAFTGTVERKEKSRVRVNLGVRERKRGIIGLIKGKMEGGSSCYSAGRDIGWHGYVVLTTECLAGRLCEGCIVLFALAFVVDDVTYRVLSIPIDIPSFDSVWNSSSISNSLSVWICFAFDPLTGGIEKGRRQRPALRDEMLSSTGCHTKALGADLGTHSLTLPEQIGPKQKEGPPPFSVYWPRA
ncbi:hypothetical protein HDV62DRAFT_116962 [Trichoderma sp. SZMC 28011]